MDRRKILFAVGGIAVLALIVFIVRGLSRSSVDETNGGQSNQDSQGIFDFFGFNGGGEEEKEARLSPRNILMSSAADYRERAKWPPDAIPINKKNDPVVEDNTILPQEIAHPKHPEGPFLVHYLTAVSYQPDQPMIIHAYLLDSNRRKIPPQTLRASLTIGGMQGRVLSNLDMRDDGSAGDTKGDMIYTAAFNLPADMRREGLPPQNYIVVVKADTEVGEIIATNAFNAGFINIRHTGKFFDHVSSDDRGNHLNIDAEFDVSKAGTYHIQGSLYSDDGEAIGWAQTRVTLQPGIQRVPLRFYGKLFCDRKADGPYLLKNFAYANVGLMPGPRSGNVQNVFRTGDYDASQFTCADYGDPDLLKKAELIEAEAKEEIR